jgi:hypothetical protein
MGHKRGLISRYQSFAMARCLRMGKTDVITYKYVIFMSFTNCAWKSRKPFIFNIIKDRVIVGKKRVFFLPLDSKSRR